jgi:pyrimidine operon attenuation protein/uracil phosphoribosyltransferase
VAERERALTPPYGGVFVGRTTVMEPEDVRRAAWRMQTGGVWLASRLAGIVGDSTSMAVPVGTLDVAFYRDDIGLRPVLPEASTDIPVELSGKTVVLVDDVLFTGRTVRAALNALSDYGRARVVQLAVMVDRGHRELPIRPDYVGKNLPTRRDEMVDVSEGGVVLGDILAR